MVMLRMTPTHPSEQRAVQFVTGGNFFDDCLSAVAVVSRDADADHVMGKRMSARTVRARRDGSRYGLFRDESNGRQRPSSQLLQFRQQSFDLTARPDTDRHHLFVLLRFHSVELPQVKQYIITNEDVAP